MLILKLDRADEGGRIYCHSPRSSGMTVSRNPPIDASLCRMVEEWSNERSAVFSTYSLEVSSL